MHLVSGYGDIIRTSGRAGLKLNSIEKGCRSKSRLPRPTEIMIWIYENMGEASADPDVKSVWVAMVVGSPPPTTHPPYFAEAKSLA